MDSYEEMIMPEVPKALPNEQLFIYVPTASNKNLGVAKFDDEHFLVDPDGMVHFRPERMVIASGRITIPITEWTDNSPHYAFLPIPGDSFTDGVLMLLTPEDDATREACARARIGVSIDRSLDSDPPIYDHVWFLRAESGEIPDSILRFVYFSIRTDVVDQKAVVALIGVDAYGEGGGTASGVDETAVKKIINSLLGNVDNVRQYSADNPPPYPVTSVNGQTGAVNLPIPSEAADVKADPIGTAENKTAALREEVNGKLADYDKSTAVNKKIGDHNVSAESHADLRLELQRLADRLNAALNSDDTSLDDLKEIVAYIKSNKTLIDGITSSKVNVTDIVDNLTTNTANVPLSAAQGVALKLLIDSLEEIVEGKITADQVAAQIKTALSPYILKDDADKTYQPAGDYPTTAKMNTAISNATKDLAPKSLIPTKVSQLSNDNGYLTTATGDQRYAKPSDIPTVPQTLPNPYALTILGKTYTGGKAVSLTAEEIMEAIKTASGGVVAYLDGNRLVMTGNLPDATYTAYYEVNGELIEIGDLTLGSITPDPVTYTIKWVNYDGEVLKTVTVAEGDSEPEYDGPTPTRAEDGQYTYTFKGWDKTVDDATGDVTYTATYTQTAKPAEPDPDPIKPKNFATPSAWVKKGRIRSNGEVATDAVETTYATDFVDCKNGDVIYISNARTNHNLLHGAYSSSKGVLGTAAYNGSNDYFVFSDTTDTSATVTIKSSSVAYMRFTLGNITDTKKVVINIKRNGEWRTK